MPKLSNFTTVISDALRGVFFFYAFPPCLITDALGGVFFFYAFPPCPLTLLLYYSNQNFTTVISDALGGVFFFYAFPPCLTSLHA